MDRGNKRSQGQTFLYPSVPNWKGLSRVGGWSEHTSPPNLPSYCLPDVKRLEILISLAVVPHTATYAGIVVLVTADHLCLTCSFSSLSFPSLPYSCLFALIDILCSHPPQQCWKGSQRKGAGGVTELRDINSLHLNYHQPIVLNQSFVFRCYPRPSISIY